MLTVLAGDVRVCRLQTTVAIPNPTGKHGNKAGTGGSAITKKIFKAAAASEDPGAVVRAEGEREATAAEADAQRMVSHCQASSWRVPPITAVLQRAV